MVKEQEIPIIHVKEGETVEAPPTSFTSKALSYSKAEISKALEGAVSQEVFEHRKMHCTTCTHRVEDKRDEIGFCTKCGCGRNKRAGLSVKLTMPKVTCPLEKWGEDKGERSLLKKAKIGLAKKLLGIKDA